MRTSKSVTVVHPDSKTRILLRSLLEGHGCTVATDHSCADLLTGSVDARPDVILVDRALLSREGIDVLSDLSRRWEEAQVVFLPEDLGGAGARAAIGPQLLGIVDRMLQLKPTREILAV
jgi:FixJ family two-component response regulator